MTDAIILAAGNSKRFGKDNKLFTDFNSTLLITHVVSEICKSKLRNIIDERTAVVLLTHDPKIDDQGIHAALNSNAFYIWCLGSKRTHSKRLGRLKDVGFSDKQLNRIHGPIGLDISAKSPAEISVSIMAQIIQIQNKLKAL